MRRWLSLVSLAVLAVVLPLAGAPTTASASAGGPVFHTYRGGIIVDPGTGRVFVAADDNVVVFDSSGAFLATIPDIFGAGTIDATGGFLWVTETTAGKIAKIDPVSMSVVQTYTVGAPIGTYLVVLKGGAFITTPAGSSEIDRYDLTTGAIDRNITGWVYNPHLWRIPGDDSAFLTAPDGLSSAEVTKVSSTAPYGSVQSSANVGYTTPLTLSPDGATFFVGGTQFATSTMQPTGPRYPLGASAMSAGRGGVLAGGGDAIYLARIGAETLTHRLPLQPTTGGSSPIVLSNGIALPPDATRVYAIEGDPSWNLRLVTEPIATSVTMTTPATVLADVPLPFTVTGSGLGGATTVTVGGVTAAFTVVSPTQLQVTMPNGVAAGTRTVTVTTPFGVASLPIGVTASPGAALSGTVRRGNGAVAGVQLTLSGGGLGASQSSTTDGAGAYSFTGLPYGTTYLLGVHDPLGSVPDFTAGPFTLTPPATTPRDLDLEHPTPPPPAETNRLNLPPGVVRDLQVDPLTGRVFVTVGDELDAFDPNGNLLKRIPQLWGVDGLAVVGTAVYANVASAGKIVRINTTSLLQTGSWPLGTPTSGDLAYTGAKLWTGTLPNGTAYSYGAVLTSLDTTTGVVTPTGATGIDSLRGIPGATNRLLTTSYYATVNVVDTSVVPPATIVSNNSGVPVVANGPSAHAWNSNGHEFYLATLLEDGVFYPGTGTVAYSAGRGGVLAFGRTVTREGLPTATQFLADDPTRSAIDTSADRIYTVTGTQALVVTDLHPHLTDTQPATVFAEAQSLTIHGSGLGAATGAALDGAAVPLSAADATQVQIDLAALAPGYHTLTVTTAWGTSAPLLLLASTRPPPPVVTSVTPGSVLTTGGPVTISGSHLLGTSAVAFATTPATSFTVVDDATITAVAPAQAAGPAAITVTTPGGTNTPAAPFTYTAPTPVVNLVAPGGGAPGTTVTVSGTGLSFPTSITFGGMAATIVSSSDTAIVATAPAHTPGVVDVVVTTAGGPSATNAADQFTFTAVAPPALNYLSPGWGSTHGGELVTIKGWTLTGASSVQFGSGSGASYSPSFKVVDDSTIVALTPARVAGDARVVVTTPLGTTPDQPSAHFQFVAPKPPGTAFHPLPPTRVLDTRTNLGIVGKIGATPSDLQLAGVGGVSATASAVVLNVTVTNPGAASFLTVFPSGGGVPNASNLNFAAGQTVPNLVTTMIGSNGRISLVNAVGATDVVADIEGYYDTASGDYYNPVSPARVLDTRTNVGITGPIGATAKTLSLAGTAGIPANGADAVVINLTVTNGTTSSFLTAFPAGTATPNASNLNFAAGQTVPNLAVVKLNGVGAIDLVNALGTVDVIGDVVGWIGPGYAGSGFIGVSPARIVDSRIGLGLPHKLSGFAPVQVTGVGGVPPTGVSAVVLNLTVTNPTANSFLTAFPAGSPLPNASNLNFAAGQTVPNLVIVKVNPGSTGQIGLYNAVGATDVVADVVGYYLS